MEEPIKFNDPEKEMTSAIRMPSPAEGVDEVGKAWTEKQGFWHPEFNEIGIAAFKAGALWQSRQGGGGKTADYVKQINELQSALATERQKVTAMAKGLIPRELIPQTQEGWVNTSKLYTKETVIDFTLKAIGWYIQGNTNIYSRNLIDESLSKFPTCAPENGKVYGVELLKEYQSRMLEVYKKIGRLTEVDVDYCLLMTLHDNGFKIEEAEPPTPTNK